MLSNVEDTEPQRHAKRLAKLLAEVLLACGVSGTLESVSDAVKKSFGLALQEIAELALKFQRTAGELVVSRDLIAVVMTPDTDFDPAAMDDEWADPKQPIGKSTEYVLCTTQLGLVREEVKEGVVHSILLVKPKVVLRSMLERLWDEMSQSE